MFSYIDVMERIWLGESEYVFGDGVLILLRPVLHKMVRELLPHLIVLICVDLRPCVVVRSCIGRLLKRKMLVQRELLLHWKRLVIYIFERGKI
jgi:hypothetical protein